MRCVDLPSSAAVLRGALADLLRLGDPRALDELLGLLDGCDGVWLPPPLCPSCCTAPSSARLAVVLVRNPFERFVAAYRQLRGAVEANGTRFAASGGRTLHGQPRFVPCAML